MISEFIDSPAINGLVYQLNGLSFFVLGVVLYMLPTQSTVFRFSKYFWLLATFGILRGIVEFLALQHLFEPDDGLITVARILEAVAFIPMLEFGRRIFINETGTPKLSAIWIYGVAIIGSIALTLIANDFYIGLAASSRIFMAFPASMLIAVASLESLKNLPKHLDTSFKQKWIKIIAATFFFHGTLSVFLTTDDPSLPEFFPDRFDFYNWFGLSIQVPRTLCAILITIGFFLIMRRINEDNRVDATSFHSKEAIMITDVNTVVIRVNDAFVKSSGYAAEEILGHKINLVKSGIHDKAFYAEMWDSINTNGVWEGEVLNKRKNGEIYPNWLTVTAIKNEAGKVVNYVGTHIDISERKAAEKEIKQLAFYDILTGLPNRRQLLDHMSYSIKLSHREGKKFAVFMMDLDKFKTVNDTQGHAAGDDLLKQVSKRITARLRESDMVARLGGDEFVIVLENCLTHKDAEKVATDVIADLTEPFKLANGNIVQIGASIGISFYPLHGITPETLIDIADTALYQAKDNGRGCFVCTK